MSGAQGLGVQWLNVLTPSRVWTLASMVLMLMTHPLLRRDGGGSDVEEAFDPTTRPPSEAAEMLIEFLLGLLYCGNGKFTAKSFCTICYWAGLAGAVDLKPWGLRPDAPTGHFQRRIDAKTNVSMKKSQEKMYRLAVPMYSRSRLTRVSHDMLAQSPMEAVVQECIEKPEIEEELRRTVATRAWPACYWEHPIVEANPDDPILPCCLYIDGVPYTKRDSVVVFGLLINTLGQEVITLQVWL